jgi:hypothetical protein
MSKSLPSLVFLLFALAFAFFASAPAILFNQFPPYELLKWGDIFDLLTPVILIPLYWLQFRFDRERKSSLTVEMLFLAIAALWIVGHGMHLAANAIGHLLGDLQSTAAYALTYFLDEGLSHWLWHIGIMGMATLLLWWNWWFKSAETTLKTILTTLAGLIFGFMFSIVIVEGGTVFMGLPFAIIITLTMLIWGRADLRQRPQLLFTLIAFGVALLAFTGWGLYWGGFPELSEVGIIT